MNEVLIMALANRIKAEPEQMTIEQVPIPLQEEVQARLSDA